MSKFDNQYLELCEKIMNEGVLCHNRTGIDTRSVVHQVLHFDLQEEFPILTCKKVAFKSAVLEMLWFYQEQSNDVRWLQERGVKIWNEWQIDENGFYQGKDFGIENSYTIGTAYGWIVKHFKLVQDLIEKIKNNPDDRRMIMSLWQNEYIATAALPSCVWNTQWRVLDGKLNCLVTQRSCDVALGLPFNVTQYAVLVHLIAHVTGLEVGQMTWIINDAHVYVNQFDGINIQIARKSQCLLAPKLWINPEIKDFFEFDNSKELKDIKLVGYENLGKIKMEVAI
ncbi:MAG: thymidylate synthase [Clostridia bacterium]